jgi:hypothetical protein
MVVLDVESEISVIGTTRSIRSIAKTLNYCYCKKRIASKAWRVSNNRFLQKIKCLSVIFYKNRLHMGTYFLPVTIHIFKVKQMVEKENAEKLQDLEQQVFEALENQKRRDILRIVGENKGIAYTKILNASKISDSPTLSYHLKNLTPFIELKEGKYRLTAIGKDAYNLLLKTHAYDKLALMQKNKVGVTVGNTVLWLGAIAAAAYLGTDAILSFVILPILAAMSVVIIYELF